MSSQHSIKLKNGSCLYFKPDRYAAIYIDVNGDEGPNSASDQFAITIDPVTGIVNDMP